MFLKDPKIKAGYGLKIILQNTSLIVVPTPNILWVTFLVIWFNILVKFGLIEEKNGSSKGKM